MTWSSDTNSSDRERRLDEAIAAYLAAEDAGDPPGRDDFLARDPELVDGLRAFFREHDRLGRLAAPWREAAGPLTGTVTAPQFTVTAGSQTTIDTKASDPARDDTLAPGTYIRYLGDYELLKSLARGAWVSFTRPARSASIARWPSR